MKMQKLFQCAKTNKMLSPLPPSSLLFVKHIKGQKNKRRFFFFVCIAFYEVESFGSSQMSEFDHFLE